MLSVMMMTKNPEFAKYASDLARAQDAVRSSNEDLIKLSQRFGRMMPKLQRLEPSTILSWFGLYNRIKDAAARADEALVPQPDVEQHASNAVLQSQIGYYYSQRARLFSKMEIMDDILNGMIEDLLENGSFEESQKEEMRLALDGTLEKSKNRVESAQVAG